jgi:hypothetical protein
MKTLLGRCIASGYEVVVDTDVLLAYDAIQEFIENELNRLFPPGDPLEVSWKRSGIHFRLE